MDADLINENLSPTSLDANRDKILIAMRDQDLKLSPQIARNLIERHQFNKLFSVVNVYTYQDIPNDERFDILRRPAIPLHWTHFYPAIIFAKK